MTALPSKVDGKSTITVQGEGVTVDRAELVVYERNIDEEMDRVAAQISYWGEMHAAAEQELMEADAHYRGWRAKLGEEMLEGVAKPPAEWKVKQAIEASPKFVEIKGRLALAKRNAIMLRTHCEAFRVKASILQSKSAMQRREEKAVVVESGKAAMKKTFKS